MPVVWRLLPMSTRMRCADLQRGHGAPAHGTLTGRHGPHLCHRRPTSGSSDNFTFKANNGGFDSNTATVTITVTSVNNAVASARSATVAGGDRSVPVVLAATDVDGDTLTATAWSRSIHGALTQSGRSPPACAPAASGYSGSDQLRLQANDSTVDSAPATRDHHGDVSEQRAGGIGRSRRQWRRGQVCAVVWLPMSTGMR